MCCLIRIEAAVSSSLVVSGFINFSTTKLSVFAGYSSGSDQTPQIKSAIVEVLLVKTMHVAM